MPAAIRIVLTKEEDRTLLELRVATCVPQRTRDRAHILCLNAQGWNTPGIAEIFECHEHTVRATIRRWRAGGLSRSEGSLRGGEQSVNGVKQTCMRYLEQCLELEGRTHNRLQLAPEFVPRATGKIKS